MPDGPAIGRRRAVRSSYGPTCIDGPYTMAAMKPAAISDEERNGARHVMAHNTRYTSTERTWIRLSQSASAGMTGKGLYTCRAEPRPCVAN